MMRQFFAPDRQIDVAKYISRCMAEKKGTLSWIKAVRGAWTRPPRRNGMVWYVYKLRYHTVSYVKKTATNLVFVLIGTPGIDLFRAVSRSFHGVMMMM